MILLEGVITNLNISDLLVTEWDVVSRLLSITLTEVGNKLIIGLES